ncbi:protein of unknown function (plasmid) [Azospirillum lipoferum 4B]|uniref:Phage-Barnase-EndoU-ColicinE5/D-RelE like nuclease 3 domain-containing protein n=1 Tax=Azospirillum lipoferum (strain 4B) TaxID=862719 RepID=G7ZFZ2_AZOL4|nr:protein of unknown function [Azospirillum lipoferum 4B]
MKLFYVSSVGCDGARESDCEDGIELVIFSVAFAPDAGSASSGPSRQFKQESHLIKRFVNQCLKSLDRVEAHEIGPLQNASRVRSKTNLDLRRFSVIVENTALKHALKQHGDASKEAKRGQEAVVEDDFCLIPEIIQDGTPSNGDGSKRGVSTILFRKSINGFEYTIVADVRSSACQLAFKTMMKSRQKHA